MAYTQPADVVEKEPAEAASQNDQNAALQNVNLRVSVIETEILPNGSFEHATDGDPDLWTLELFKDAIREVDITTRSDGLKSLKCSITATGGYARATNDTLIPISEGARIECEFWFKTTAATARVRQQILWLDSSGTLVTTSNVFDSATGNPSSWTRKNGSAVQVVCPSGAYFYKVRLIAGEQGNAVAADVFFDSIRPRIYKGIVIIDRDDPLLYGDPYWNFVTGILDLSQIETNTPVPAGENAVGVMIGIEMRSGVTGTVNPSTMATTGNGKAGTGLTTGGDADAGVTKRFISYSLELDDAQQATIAISLGAGGVISNKSDFQMWLLGYRI